MKCVYEEYYRGKVDRTEGVELPEGRTADIQDSYKYLGIPQANGSHVIGPSIT
ncbi:hypothetical protein LDENG_00094320 [Lucifuga dentata]|nr:hypothetical protein LDENG_00094320 [Lucifuga dentata]